MRHLPIHLLFFLIHTSLVFFFFFNDTATTEIYTLSLHDALPISRRSCGCGCSSATIPGWRSTPRRSGSTRAARSEEHTSELQSRGHLVCRLLLEKKKKKNKKNTKIRSDLKARSQLVDETVFERVL